MASIFDLFRKIEKPRERTTPPEYLAVGLGNPGRDYAGTRHNAGFEAIDFICGKLGTECRESKFKAFTARVTSAEKSVLLMKPTTFMNNSGEAVRDAASFYKIPPEKIVVFCDDINFDAGKMRIRERGSDGGHNGLKSIIECLSSDNFARVRIGVGKKPSPDTDLISWVLGKIPEDDVKKMTECLIHSADILELIVSGKIQDAMSEYNKR
ncbi:MAG: aminoacyl-tRNA hydrolase [Clostridia bacterium]|nr:aminoacyl-tRNA hydrolase [Clostridia bacterium]